jgi:predicted regulator of Ras-like GTPase activity (Roadblock/LC7/MglB family)
VAAPAPAAPVPPGKEEYVAIPLVSVTLGWPEPIRQALAGLNVPDAILNLPVSETEQALKRGKVVFQWKRLKPLIKPPLKTALAPALDEVQLELPLPAVAPLFMAQRKPAAAQKKYAVGEDIPDVFSAKGMLTSAPPVSAPVAAPAAPAPASMPAPVASAPKPAPAPIPMAHAPAPALKLAPAPAIPAVAPASPPAARPAALPTEIGELFGQPGRKNWAPAEIVQRTAALPGVAGAVITMQDGLLVAGHLPPGLNGEAIAAFLPQMYSRMMQYCKELKFGESDTFTLVVDNVALRIHRAGGLYFAALGRSNEALPDPQLRLIASHLAPQSK